MIASKDICDINDIAEARQLAAIHSAHMHQVTCDTRRSGGGLSNLLLQASMNDSGARLSRFKLLKGSSNVIGSSGFPRLVSVKAADSSRFHCVVYPTYFFGLR